MKNRKILFISLISIFTLNSSLFSISNGKVTSNLVTFVSKEKNDNDAVVFIKNKRSENTINPSSLGNNPSYLDYFFFFENDGHLQKGEIYRTYSQTDSQIKKLKLEIKENVKNKFYSSKSINSSIYTGAFKIGSDYENINESTIIRVMDATKGNEKLGTLTDYQNEFAFKNSKNTSSLFYVITHEIYLSPVQTSNGNYKGVGVQGILNLNGRDTSQIVRDYGPKASQQKN